MKSNKLCECGCGQLTPICKETDNRRGHIKGQPIRFILGHNMKVWDPPAHFWERVNKEGPLPSLEAIKTHPEIENEKCWVWEGGKTTSGYGQVHFYGDNKTAHRVAWFLQYGEWPKDNACHKCDNKACVRHSHLFNGDALLNVTDMKNKGRNAKGETTGGAKLTASQIIEIKARYVPYKVTRKMLADEYGVHERTIQQVVYNETWRHLG